MPSLALALYNSLEPGMKPQEGFCSLRPHRPQKRSKHHGHASPSAAGRGWSAGTCC